MFRTTFFICFCLTTLLAFGQQEVSVEKKDGLFSDNTPLKTELRFDVKKFIKTKYKDEYLPATMSIIPAEGDTLTTDIRLKARGEFRRRYCSFPPIKLNFKGSELESGPFSDLSTLKLVNSCRYQTLYQDYIFREYLVYELFQLFSPLSFKARLLDITYIDSEGKREPLQKYGFVIEHVEHMAARNNAFELDPPRISMEMTDRKQLLIISFFNYMIGNADWHVGSLHNVKIIKSREFIADEQPSVVPYDFDYSGIVNTTYAVPPEDLGFSDIRQRFYKGPCFTENEGQAVADLFLSKKEAVLSIYRDSPWLDNRYKNETIEYLEEFYETISSSRSIKNYMLSTCIE